MSEEEAKTPAVESEEIGASSARAAGLAGRLVARMKADPRIPLIAGTMLLSCIILVAVPSPPPPGSGNEQDSKHKSGSQANEPPPGISSAAMEKLEAVAAEVPDSRRRVQPVLELALQHESRGLTALAADLRRIADVMMRGIEAETQAERLFAAGRFRAARALYFVYLAAVDEHTLPQEVENLARASLRIGQCFFREATSAEGRAGEPADVDLYIGPLKEGPRDHLSVEPDRTVANTYRLVAYGMPADQLFRLLEARGPGFPIILPATFTRQRVSAVMTRTPMLQAIEELAGIFSYTAAVQRRGSEIDQIQLVPEPSAEQDPDRHRLLELGLEALTRALYRYPQSQHRGIAYETSGKIFEALGQNERAIQEYLSLIENLPADPLVPAVLLRLGILHEEEHRWEMARSFYDRIINEYHHSPEVPQALNRVGMILLDQEDPRAARTYLGVLLDQFPTCEYAGAAQVGFLEASILLDLQSPSPGVTRALLSKLSHLALLASDPLTRPRYLRLSTKVLLRLGKRSEAVREALAAAHEYGDQPATARELYLTAATVALEQGDPLGAYFIVHAAPELKDPSAPDHASEDLDVVLLRASIALDLEERLPARLWSARHIPARLALQAARWLAQERDDPSKLELLAQREDTAEEALLILARHEVQSGAYQRAVDHLLPRLLNQPSERLAAGGFEILGDAYAGMQSWDLAARAYTGEAQPAKEEKR